MSDPLLSAAEHEALLAARLRLLKVPPERIVPAQTAPAAAFKLLFDALDADSATTHAAVLAFITAVNELCDGAARKQGRVNVSAVEAAEHGFDALADRLALDLRHPAAALRVLRDRRAAARQLDVQSIEAKLGARTAARRNRDFATADSLHNELRALGVVVVDEADGSDWTLND